MGEAREVQKEVGSFWGKVSDSHLQLHQERRERRVVSERGTVDEELLVLFAEDC